MVHLFYNFKELEAKNNWSIEDGLHVERNQRFNNLIRAFRHSGINKVTVFDKKGVRVKSDDIYGFKQIYLEINHKDLTVKVRHLTYSSDDYIGGLKKIANDVLTSEYRSFVSDSPCNRCGKEEYYNGYDGICMDCADELCISELFIDNKDYEKNLKKASVYLDSTQRRVGSSRFIIPHPKMLSAIKDLERAGLLTQKEGIVKLTEKGHKKAKTVESLLDDKTKIIIGDSK